MKTTLCLLVLVIAVIVSIVGFRGGGDTPEVSLLDAINQHDVFLVQQHMDAGTNPNKTFVPEGSQYFEGAYALHLAVFNKDKTIVKLLVESGADVNIRADDAAGGTALHWAAFWGSSELVGLLINAGADVNATDNGRCTPLCAATAENPFVPTGDEDFQLRRNLIQVLLQSQGAE